MKIMKSGQRQAFNVDEVIRYPTRIALYANKEETTILFDADCESISLLTDDVRKKMANAIEPVLWEAKQRCPWWEPDYNENAHVEITLTIADVRRLFRLQQFVAVVGKDNEE